jgi:hypothetical protein
MARRLTLWIVSIFLLAVIPFAHRPVRGGV